MSTSTALRKRQRKISSLNEQRATLAAKAEELRQFITYCESEEFQQILSAKSDEVHKLVAYSKVNSRKELNELTLRITDLDARVNELERVITALSILKK